MYYISSIITIYISAITIKIFIRLSLFILEETTYKFVSCQSLTELRRSSVSKYLHVGFLTVKSHTAYLNMGITDTYLSKDIFHNH